MLVLIRRQETRANNRLPHEKNPMAHSLKGAMAPIEYGFYLVPLLYSAGPSIGAYPMGKSERGSS